MEGLEEVMINLIYKESERNQWQVLSYSLVRYVSHNGWPVVFSVIETLFLKLQFIVDYNLLS